jgi:methylmalonyl-CoA mutase N-terminal domain/subunit
MDIARLRQEFEHWRARSEAHGRPREDLFETISGRPVKPLYTPLDVAGQDYARDLGFPGEFPYTRGIHDSMYRGRLWTMRQFSGYGTARDTNRRYHYLLEHGQTGLSVAFDFPTLMGYDSDSPRSLGEVGKCGVAVDSLRDMETLFDGIPLDRISTSMTINGPAAILFAFYVAAAEKQGVSGKDLRGTLQNDILKEYVAQHAWCFPPEPALRLIVDLMAYCAEHVPQWNPISISGYHIREAGSTAGQELAFTLANGFEYVRRGIASGMKVDDFAPRLSFFWDCHTEFFEEIAKMRAARRIWAREMRDTYQARDPGSWLVRFHTQTAGCSLTAQQPENNIVRTAFEGLAAVLGGTQSLHTNAMDETLALPTEKTAKIALRTQQIIAHELGVTHTADPLGGSYFVEALTDDLEREALEYFKKIEARGGVVPCIESGWFQGEIARASRKFQEEVESGRRVIVGVNKYVEEGGKLEIPVLYIDDTAQTEQAEGLSRLRADRNPREAEAALAELRRAAATPENLVPILIRCAHAYCTEGEIVGILRGVFGEYHEPAYSF